MVKHRQPVRTLKMVADDDQLITRNRSGRGCYGGMIAGSGRWWLAAVRASRSQA